MKTARLSLLQRSLILGLFPEGAQVGDTQYFRQEYLPCPIRVSVFLRDGSTHNVVLRLSRTRLGVEREAKLLPILSQLGLPVPKVLAGPTSDANSKNAESVTVLSLLPGRNLQDWSCASGAGLETAGQLLIQAVDRLRQLTEPLNQELAASDIPRQDMTAELDILMNSGSAWVSEPVFRDAASHLKPIVASIQTPLCFSNGDYQPANFLSDGKDITGFVDFESACFEDPHIGFAKYRIYDLHPLNKAGIVESYLQAHNLSEYDFAPRMAVRCLWTLQREVPVSERDGSYGTHILRLLHDALKLLN